MLGEGALVTFAGAGHLVCSLFSAAARLSVVALCVLYRKSSVTSARAAAASPRSVAATNDSTSCVGVTVAAAAVAVESEGAAASEKGAAAESAAVAAAAKAAARAEAEDGEAAVLALRSVCRCLRRSLAALATLISVCVR